MKDELADALKRNHQLFYNYLVQDIQHIERYPIDDKYKSIIIQSANAIKKIDSSNNHIYSCERIYGIGPNCKQWVKKKFGIRCIIPDKDFSSVGLIEKIKDDGYNLGKTLLLKGIGGKRLMEEYLFSEKIDFKISNVYERILNEDNLRNVLEKAKEGAIILAFSKSSIEPLLNEDLNLNKIHFIVLDKSDEDIIDENCVASLTKIDDIYEIDKLVEKIVSING